MKLILILIISSKGVILTTTAIITSNKFSSHSRDISLEVGAEVVRDFTGDEGTYGILDGDVTRVKILFTGDNVSL
jgi:hypothetical protein